MTSATQHPVVGAVHIPGVPPAGEDLLLWRDPKQSGIVLASASLIYFFLGSPWSPLTPMQLVAVFVLLTAPAFWAWNFAAPYLKRHGPPVPAFFRDGVTSKELDQVAEPALKIINPFLGVVGRLISGQDAKLTVAVSVGAFVAFRLFRYISLFTLSYLVVLVAFTLPKVYELKKADIDKVLNVVVSKTKELYAEVEKVVFKKAGKPSAKLE